MSDDGPDLLWRPDEHEPLTERSWEPRCAHDAVAAIVADAEAAETDGVWPVHPRDEEPGDSPFTTLYLGSAGMVWALHELGTSLDLPALMERAMARYRAAPDFGEQAHPRSLWMGEVGLLVAAAKVRSPVADQRRLRDLIRENRDHPTWELMWGSPGTMLAARMFGLGVEWQESARLLWERWDEKTDLWTQSLYGRVAQYLGPAHGFAANAHVLRGYVSDDVLRDRVRRSLQRTALRDNGLINWPPVADPSPGGDLVRVQWCHGAPGLVATLGDLMPLDLALGGGELIWEAGPLRKGACLCHGTAGNGYAFLRLFRLTGDERWLERARRFAMHAIAQVRSERDRVGRGRYGIWTGDIGVALYLRACVDGDPAFPTIDAL